MFCRMVDKCIMTQWQQFSAFWQQQGHVEMQKYTLFLSILPTRKDNFKVSVLVIEYLVAMSYELRMT